MALADLIYKTAVPSKTLSPYVESFWMLSNPTDETKEVIVLPDGRVDVFFSYSLEETFNCSLAGLGSEPSQGTIAPQSVMFAVSFKLLAVEYLLNTSIAPYANLVDQLPEDFWNIKPADLNDFGVFSDKLSAKLESLLVHQEIDPRKQKLFELIYATQGAMSVHELADTVGWSSRQINRYFNQWFGLSLKTYCNILRYRASFTEIKEGKLFSAQNFADQAHFIKDVKKFSGVTPKELSKNKNDRFIQFSTLPKK